MKIVIVFAILAATFQQALWSATPSQNRAMTLEDEIGVALFGDPYTGMTEAVTISPDGRYVVAHTERGLLPRDRLLDELRVYSVDDLKQSVNAGNKVRLPEPTWSIRESSYREGPLISDIRWLPNSTSVAYLRKTSEGNRQLVLATVAPRKISELSLTNQDVTAFDIVDLAHYVYAVRDQNIVKSALLEREKSSVLETGRSLYTAFFPEAAVHDRSILWGARDGHPNQINDEGNHLPIVLYSLGQRCLRLSPDGRMVATALPLAVVPTNWPNKYRPPSTNPNVHFISGVQDINAGDGRGLVSQYVVLDLGNGRIQGLMPSPEGSSVGWWTVLRPTWSFDGKQLILPNVFVDNDDPKAASTTPCIAVVSLTMQKMSCLEPLKIAPQQNSSEGGYYVTDAQFLDGASDRVSLRLHLFNETLREHQYSQSRAGDWDLKADNDAVQAKPSVEITVQQGLNEPPALVVTDNISAKSRIVWDPNPQLKGIDLGKASVYRWKDDAGRERIGGLYKPPGYQPGQRYPLVIQTHGFSDGEFRPSGRYPTAFAARALSAAGIVVLQDQGCAERVTPGEGACNVSGYQSAVKQLSLDGLIDSNRVGIIGFSRTCYYVLEALTASDLSIRAASVTDGVDYGYFQYLASADTLQSIYTREADTMMGAPPFGRGIESWFRNSPGFNLDKVKTPLMIVGEGPPSLLFMWGSYAGLRLLHKPVELIQLNSREHVLTEPRVRLASQGGSVDWFRFWLQDYEDPDPAKAEQYRRWQHLRELRDANAETSEQMQPISSKHK